MKVTFSGALVYQAVEAQDAKEVVNYPLPRSIDELNSFEYMSYLCTHRRVPFLPMAVMIIKLIKWTAEFCASQSGLTKRTVERIISGVKTGVDFRTAFLIVMCLPISCTLALYMLQPFSWHLDKHDERGKDIDAYLYVLIEMHGAKVKEWNDFLEKHGVPRLDT